MKSHDPRPRRPLGSHRAAAAQGAAQAQGRPARASPTAPPSPASSSSCGPAAPGACCRRSWAAAAASPAGGGCATGKRPASGSGCTRRLLNWLGDEAAIDWSRASLDSLSVRAKKGGEQTGPNPTDRGKPGSKYHLVVDRNGIPLAVRLSAANAHDSTQLLPLIDAIPPIIGPRGTTGPAPEAPGQAARRQGVRLGREAPRAACPRHHPADRPPRHRVERAAGAAPLGGGAQLRLAARLPPPRRPLRAAGGSAPGLLHLACALICLKFLDTGGDR